MKLKNILLIAGLIINVIAKMESMNRFDDCMKNTKEAIKESLINKLWNGAINCFTTGKNWIANVSNNALPQDEQPDAVEIKLISKIKTLKTKTPLFLDNGEWFTQEELEKKAQDLGYKLFINPNTANKNYSTDRQHPGMIITTIYGVDALWERFNPTAKKMVKTAESEWIKNDIKPEFTSGILNNTWNIVQEKPFTSMLFLGYSAICGAIINAYYNLYQKYKNASNKRDKKTIIRKILDPVNLLGITVPFIFLIVVGRDLLEPIK